MLRYLTVLIILIIPSFWFLLTPNYYNMHDDLHPIRQLEMEKCIKDGQIPCRWVPDMGNGYGYPLFNYYPPLPYIFGQIIRLFGFSFLWTYKITAIAQIIFSSLAIFLLGKKMFGPTAGLLSAIFFAYAPYHAVNIFVRGALNEAWASIFFPLIFLFIYKLSEKLSKTNVILLSLSVSGLLLSHNPMTIIFTPFIFLWSIFSLVINRHLQIKYIISFLISAIVAFSFSAFFILPSIFEISLINTSALFSDYYAYFVHFATISQLFFSSFWGDGASTWGTNDQMSFSIGYLHWIIPLLSFFLVFIHVLKTKKLPNNFIIYLFLFGCGFFTTFMTHQRSSFIWEMISPVQKIQFPWRFLNLTMFFFSTSIGFLYIILKKYLSSKKAFMVIALSMVAVMILNLSYFIPLNYGPITDHQKFTGSWKNFTTGSITDYLPIAVKDIPHTPPTGLVSSILPPDSATITNQKHGTDWLSFNAQAETKSLLTISQFYFPNHILYLNQKSIPFEVNQQGLITFSLDPGLHQVYLKLNSTPIRTVSNLLSFIAWLILLCLVIIKVCQKIRPLFKT